MATETTAKADRILEAGWQALPALYRPPAETPTLEQARAWCKQLTETHYENFTVASWFLPERLRPHFNSIYAYCRVSDDLGDEVGNVEQSLALLDDWNRQLDECYNGIVHHPVFVALAETIRACDIPKAPFADLLFAFKQDQTKRRYANREEVLDYCRNSANPVGRLVLYAGGYRDEERFRLSDATCTALQLANFLQDVSVDWNKDRVYIPQDDMQRHGVTESDIATGNCTEAFRALMREAAGWARQLFAEGLPLIGQVDRELALDLDLFSRGGLEILAAIEKQNYDVLTRRPALSKSRKLALMARALSSKFIPLLRLGKAV